MLVSFLIYKFHLKMHHQKKYSGKNAKLEYSFEVRGQMLLSYLVVVRKTVLRFDSPDACMTLGDC